MIGRRVEDDDRGLTSSRRAVICGRPVAEPPVRVTAGAASRRRDAADPGRPQLGGDTSRQVQRGCSPCGLGGGGTDNVNYLFVELPADFVTAAADCWADDRGDIFRRPAGDVLQCCHCSGSDVEADTVPTRVHGTDRARRSKQQRHTVSGRDHQPEPTLGGHHPVSGSRDPTPGVRRAGMRHVTAMDLTHAHGLSPVEADPGGGPRHRFGVGLSDLGRNITGDAVTERIAHGAFFHRPGGRIDHTGR